MRGQTHGRETRRMLSMFGRLSMAAAALAAVCAASIHWLLADWATEAFAYKVSALGATVVAGALVFVGAGAALHVEELDEVLGAVKRRLRSIR
jgi:TRAP-type C4-dicarboxylate transport system permease small subunit